MPLSLGHYLFKPRLVPSLMSLVFVLLFIVLGRWQWQRADYKQGLHDNYVKGMQSAALTIEAVRLLGKDVNSFPITVEGHFDNAHSILLDNQVENMTAGFHVFTPLIITSAVGKEEITAQQHVILIDRGWLPLGKDRMHFTAIPPLEDKKFRISGKVYFPSEKAFVLQRDRFEDIHWPLLVQTLDLPGIGKALGVELPAFVVRPNDDQLIENGPQLIRHWQFMVMGPEKSRGYSFQWYAMALVLFLFYVYFSIEKVKPND